MTKNDSAVIDKIAERIRALWCEEVRLYELRTKGASTNWGSTYLTKWDGGRTANGTRCEPVWPKIAMHCINHNLDPDKLVRAMFHGAINYTPYPNMAHGADALAKYALYTSPKTELELTNKLTYEFEAQKSRAISTVMSMKTYQAMDEQTAWKCTLASKDEPLSYLFRYCVAKNQGWHDIAQLYEVQARKQYERHKGLYDKIWSDWIPTELSAKDMIDA